jgi:hypothetical protein
MTVISSSFTRCAPGRRDDFKALALEGMKLFERHGARHVRLLAPATAGEQSTTYVLTNEFENAADYGAFVDDLYRDAELDAYVARMNAPESPLVVESRSLATELPLDRNGSTIHGSVIESYEFTVVPGRFEQCRDLAHMAFDFFEQCGATNCRWMELTDAGNRSGHQVGLWEFENMQAWGNSLDSLRSNPAGTAILETLHGDARPISLVSSGIYRDLHM